MVEVVPGFGLGRVLVAKDLGEIPDNHQERRQRLAVTVECPPTLIDGAFEVSLSGSDDARVIQARLGHATITETMDTYGHLFPDAEDLGRGAIDAVFAVALTEQGRNQDAN
jgi:hypothetical protein